MPVDPFKPAAREDNLRQFPALSRILHWTMANSKRDVLAPDSPSRWMKFACSTDTDQKPEEGSGAGALRQGAL
jgi:hypothetical protein